MPKNILLSLRNSFEFSPLPYKVDIVDLNTITPEFRKAIEPQLIQLYP